MVKATGAVAMVTTPTSGDAPADADPGEGPCCLQPVTASVAAKSPARAIRVTVFIVFITIYLKRVKRLPDIKLLRVEG
jgi:hypothetical protein